MANANGFADGELLPLRLAIDNLRRIVDATDLPVTVDLESGYGDLPEVVAETIGLAIDAKAVGWHMSSTDNLWIVARRWCNRTNLSPHAATAVATPRKDAAARPRQRLHP